MHSIFKPNLICLSSSFLLCLMLNLSHASNLQKELRMQQQIIDYIIEGSSVMLHDTVARRDFLSIFTEATTDTARGAVIIMHGRGYHPDWPELVYPLRTGLPDYGWHTLSIQMPVLDNSASFYDYLEIQQESYPRIEAAIRFLQQKRINHIVLLAHSCSVHMAVAWLDTHPQANVHAFIGVGMGSTDKGQPMRKAFPLEKIKIPVLDIRGEYDYPAVIRNAPRRLKNIRQAGNPKSAQQVVADADHYFTARGNTLLTRVADWLEEL